MEAHGTLWKVMELLEYSMGFLCAMIYNKLTRTSKERDPSPTVRYFLLPGRPLTVMIVLRPREGVPTQGSSGLLDYKGALYTTQE